MRFVSVLCASALLAVSAQAVHAKEMHCQAWENFKSKIDKKQVTKDGTKYNFTVKKTWKTLGYGATSDDYNGFIKIYAEEGKTSDKTTNFGIRPRKSSPECLVAVESESKDLWKGSYCNNDKKKNFDGFKLTENKETGTWDAAGGASTLSKVSQFISMYIKHPQNPDDPLRYLAAVCIEDK